MHNSSVHMFWSSSLLDETVDWLQRPAPRRARGEPICTVLNAAGVQIAQSTYNAAKHRPPSVRAVRDTILVEDIKVALNANLDVYGARKVHAELNREARRSRGAPWSD